MDGELIQITQSPSRDEIDQLIKAHFLIVSVLHGLEAKYGSRGSAASEDIDCELSQDVELIVKKIALSYAVLHYAQFSRTYNYPPRIIVRGISFLEAYQRLARINLW